MKRILFVDDESAVLDGLRTVLRRQRKDWEMIFAVGPEAGLVELAKPGAPFHVVVSDMRMPGMDGAEFLKVVKERSPDTVRIVLSGHAAPEIVRRVLPVVHQFIAKPCESDQLRAVLERACTLQPLFSNPLARRLLGAIEALPAAPEIARELADIRAGGAARAAELGGLCARDPALAAKVLQLANSRFLDSPRSVGSLAGAVALIGPEALRGLLAQPAPAGAQPGGLPERVQGHSLRVARAAQLLAADTPHADEAFAAGLLHDLGRLALSVVAPEGFGQALAEAERTQRSSALVEQELPGLSHAEAGAYLLGLWGLPLATVEAVQHHHHPSAAAAGGRGLLPFVHVADALVNELEASEGPASAEAQPPPAEAQIDRAYLESVGLLERLPAWRVALHLPA